MDATRTPGYTLAELLIVLLVICALSTLVAPPARRVLDRVAVTAARDELASAVARTRSAAISAGGATLIVELGEGAYRIERRDGAALVPFVDLASAYGVTLVSDGASAEVSVSFDALGIGRLANRTIRVRRGGAEARLTLSAYGRVRRW